MALTLTLKKSETPELTDDYIVCEENDNFHIQISDVYTLWQKKSDNEYLVIGNYHNLAMAIKRLEVKIAA
jgi:hypothetical protein